MSTGAIVAIIVVVIIVAAVLVAVAAANRRRRLRERFGPEYDRAVSEHGSRREAEAELAGRERHVRELDLRPLSPSARSQYLSEWTAVQEQFVDAPQAAVTGAQTLVSAVMEDRGYPTQPYDQTLADLSVEHASTLDHFRAAHDISQNAASGTASTEDLRQAMIHYRALFAELLGEPAARLDGRHVEPGRHHHPARRPTRRWTSPWRASPWRTSPWRMSPWWMRPPWMRPPWMRTLRWSSPPPRPGQERPPGPPARPPAARPSIQPPTR